VTGGLSPLAVLPGTSRRARVRAANRGDWLLAMISPFLDAPAQEAA